MQRRKFIGMCSYTAIGLPLSATLLQACSGIHYATSTLRQNKLVLARTEFQEIKKNKVKDRRFVLLETEKFNFPICVYKNESGEYMASLMECTHRGCELNVGGGIYSCPCHGSEFSTYGKVLQGPAEHDLKTFKTEIDSENIYIHFV